jgi:hypothetical protein
MLMKLTPDVTQGDQKNFVLLEWPWPLVKNDKTSQ